MQYWCGATLLPFADAIIESQQVGKALWVLKGRTLALGALDKREGTVEVTQCAGQAPPGQSLSFREGKSRLGPPSFYKVNPECK